MRSQRLTPARYNRRPSPAMTAGGCAISIGGITSKAPALALRGQFEQHLRTNTNTEDLRELPAYGIAEAAHYLLIPRATLRSWLAGMSYRTGFFKPVIEPAARSPLALSFVNLIEAHVLAAIRRKHRVDMADVRRTIE